MSTYRYGKWTQWDGVQFYSVDKKMLFGWHEVEWWRITENGRSKMMDLVAQLKERGHIVIAS